MVCLDPDCPAAPVATAVCPACGHVAVPVTGGQPGGQSWALLLDEGPRDVFVVLVVVQVVAEQRPPLAVHHIRRSASVRALAESGWIPGGIAVHRSWGLAIPVEPGDPARPTWPVTKP